ncbi:MAG: flavodoxin domain-containing protein [Candidatus Bathyarchaeota archaeon]|nr:flavodoxin domain-containing protein [Candidatus Bathyarchaeota archaeon]
MSLLTKIFITFASWFGNTEAVAKEIGKGILQIDGTEVAIKKIKEVNAEEVLEYDAILIGSPNHMGGPTRAVKKLIDKLGNLGLEGKKGAVFDTYVRKNVHVGKTVRKMEKKIKAKIAGMKLIVDGLSILVKGVRGPIAEGELSKCGVWK